MDKVFFQNTLIPSLCFGLKMSGENIEIRFVNSWPEDELVKLYKAGGWWKDTYDKSKLKGLIKGSFAFAVVIDKNQTIGMGRILSDGISDAYIQDLIILPEYRKQGIGKKLVDKLIEYCHSKDVKWIALIAEPDQDGFYSSAGFKHMKNCVPMKFEE